MALLIPKGKRNRENKLNLNEGTILCLLDDIDYFLEGRLLRVSILIRPCGVDFHRLAVSSFPDKDNFFFLKFRIFCLH